ncbi:MAG: DUF2516 family protein [bacterium]|nr:DUF2516 family protein [bacterium]
MQLYAILMLGLLWLLSLPLLLIEAYALADAVRRPGAMYEAYGKRTKGFWMILLMVGVLLGIFGLPITPGGSNLFLTVLAVLPAGVYLADVRPAVRGRW